MRINFVWVHSPARRGDRVDEFKAYLLNDDANKRSNKTILRHLRYIKKILTNCPHLDESEILTFYALLKERGCKNTYLNHLTSTLKLYGHFKNLPHLISWKYRKEEKFERAVMSAEEVESFLSLPCPKHAMRALWYHWTVFFTIGFMTGMRPGEIAALEVNDIDFGLLTIHIRHGKTPGSVGEVPMPENLAVVLKGHLSQIKGQLLFPSPKGGTGGGGVVTSIDWWSAFHKRINILGIKRTNLSVYSTRHTYGSMLAWEDVNLYTIKELMRHTDIKTTERYMHRNMKSMKKAQTKLPFIAQELKPQAKLQQKAEVIKSWLSEKSNGLKYTYVEDSNSFHFECQIEE